MKKALLFVAALFAAVTLNAREITVDLSTYNLLCSEDATANVSIADGTLTVNYVTTAGWKSAAVEFALNNLTVDSLSFEYIGDATVEEWVSLYGYLKDTDGIRWYSSAADLSISSWNVEWELNTYFPTDALWDTPVHAAGTTPYVAIGFMANPSVAKTGSFAVRNVKLYVPGEETGINNVATQVKAVKVVRNGQVLFLRDGKTFNVLGAEIK